MSFNTKDVKDFVIIPVYIKCIFSMIDRLNLSNQMLGGNT
jgi:hypothetical protein